MQSHDPSKTIKKIRLDGQLYAKSNHFSPLIFNNLYFIFPIFRQAVKLVDHPPRHVAFATFDLSPSEVPGTLIFVDFR